MKKKLYLFFSTIVMMVAAKAQEQITLNDALLLAQKGNRNIQMGFLETNKLEETIKEERSYLQPTISATASYTLYAERPVIFLREQSLAGKVNAVEIGGRNVMQAGISGSYPIYAPVLHNRIKMAEINTHLQKEKTNDLSSRIMLDVAQTYYAIQFYREQVMLFRQSLQRNERALTDSRLLLLQGKGLRVDTLRNYIDVQNLKASISSVESQIQIQLLHLKQLIGVEEGTSLELTDKLDSKVQNDFFQKPDSLVYLAVENRPDVKMHELQLLYNKEEQKQVRSEFRPSLHAVAQYQVQSQSDKFSFWNYSVPRTSFVGLQLNVPIYSGRREKARRDKVHVGFHQTQLALAELKQSISIEIKTILEKINDAYRQKAVQDKNVEAAQVSFTMINDRYRHGLSNRLELADAEVVLTQAKINQLHAVYILKTLEWQLKRASGLLKAE